MFILLILISIGICKDFSAYIDTLANNKFSTQILEGLQNMLQNKQTSSYDLISYLNQQEDNLVQEILDDQQEYQQKQMKSAEEKQEIKYQLLLTKFTQNSQNDELNLLQNESKLADDICQQRQELTRDLSQLIPILELQRKDEELHYENQLYQIKQFDSLLQISNEQQEQQLSSTNTLTGQRSHKTKEYNNPQDLLMDLQEKSIIYNPFVDVVEKVKQCSNSKEVIQGLQKLTQQQKSYIEQLNQIRHKLYSDLKVKLQQDNERWKVDMQQISPIAKITKEKITTLMSQSDQMKENQNQLQQKYSDLQEEIDNIYTSYSSKRLQDMNNLNLVRMIKQILSDNTDSFEDYLKNKYKKQTQQ